MKNRNLFLVIGSVIILLTFVVLLVSYFDPYGVRSLSPGQTILSTESVSGDVSIRRNGNNYVLQSGTDIVSGDTVMVGRNGECILSAAGVFRVTMDKDCQAFIEGENECSSLKIMEGAAFFDLIQAGQSNPLSIRTEFSELEPDTGAVFSVEAYTGTQTINLYSGTAILRYNGKVYSLQGGDHISMVQSEDAYQVTKTDILASELRLFLLRELTNRGGLGFETGYLNRILEDRQSSVIPDTADKNGERLTCSVEIRCDTVLAQNRKPPVDVPKDGIILAPTPVKFTQGESAYDVLRRVCKAAGIEIDYNYTVMFGGYYIIGIDGIYENNYGNNSGWLFQVNGWFPNYGSGKYEVEDGDVIVWHYSCDGGGTDLGREEWTEKPISN